MTVAEPAGCVTDNYLQKATQESKRLLRLLRSVRWPTEPEARHQVPACHESAALAIS